MDTYADRTAIFYLRQLLNISVDVPFAPAALSAWTQPECALNNGLQNPTVQSFLHTVGEAFWRCFFFAEGRRFSVCCRVMSDSESTQSLCSFFLFFFFPSSVLPFLLSFFQRRIRTHLIPPMSSDLSTSSTRWENASLRHR